MNARVIPKVPLSEYWQALFLLGFSLASPVVGFCFKSEPLDFARSGSFMVFFAACAEFVSINRAQNKHI